MDKNELPENIRQAIDLIIAVFRRSHPNGLDKSSVKSLCISNMKGCSA